MSCIEADPYHDSDDSKDDDFECSDSDSESSEMEALPETDKLVESDSALDENPKNDAMDISLQNQQTVSDTKFMWSINLHNFLPKKSLLDDNQLCIITANVNRSSSMLECFYKLFPKSVTMQIAHYTNHRLGILEKTKNKKIQKTSTREIKTVLGVMRFPAMQSSDKRGYFER